MKRFFKIILKIMLAIISLVVLLVIATLIVVQLPQFGQKPGDEHLEQIRQSPQHNGKTFENDGKVDVHFGLGKMGSVLRAYWDAPADRSPADTFEILHPDPADIGKKHDSLLMITWFGHSAFLLEMEGKILMLDPMLGPASSPFSFMTKRFNRNLAVSFEDLPEIDAVLLSHDHYDHLDYPSIVALDKKVGRFFVPLGLGSHLQRWGVEPSKITELDWWDEIEFEGLRFACTPSQHFSGRSVNDRNCTLWASWAIMGQGKRLFFSGDSGYFPGFKTIGEKYGPFDIALMECGQYNELWQEIHMMPEETAQACVDVQSAVLMPIHWGMFNLSLHPWTEPVTRVSMAASALGLTLVTPQVGERFALNDSLPAMRWWEQ